MIKFLLFGFFLKIFLVLNLIFFYKKNYEEERKSYEIFYKENPLFIFFSKSSFIEDKIENYDFFEKKSELIDQFFAVKYFLEKNKIKFDKIFITFDLNEKNFIYNFYISTKNKISKEDLVFLEKKYSCLKRDNFIIISNDKKYLEDINNAENLNKKNFFFDLKEKKCCLFIDEKFLKNIFEKNNFHLDIFFEKILSNDEKINFFDVEIYDSSIFLKRKIFFNKKDQFININKNKIKSTKNFKNEKDNERYSKDCCYFKFFKKYEKDRFGKDKEIFNFLIENNKKFKKFKFSKLDDKNFFLIKEDENGDFEKTFNCNIEDLIDSLEKLSVYKFNLFFLKTSLMENLSDIIDYFPIYLKKKINFLMNFKYIYIEIGTNDFENYFLQINLFKRN
jgi:hypothetical protein